MTTNEPERIWTANWSSSQIHHLTALQETAQTLPTDPCGLAALASELLQLSRILSRTALQLWMVKTSIESPILRRQRITAAEAVDTSDDPVDGEAVHPSDHPSTPTAEVPPTAPTKVPTLAPSNVSTTAPTDVSCHNIRQQPYVHAPDSIDGHPSKHR